MSEHYHQVIPESICQKARGLVQRALGFVAIDWDPPFERVEEFPEHLTIDSDEDFFRGYPRD